MLHLFDIFFDIIENTKIFLVDKNKEEVYFFAGKKSLLCINKADDRVLCNLNLNQIQIQITSPSSFTLSVGSASLAFSQEPEEKTLPKSVNFNEDKKGVDAVYPQEKYKNKSFCDQCISKKCSQYDTINGRNFKLGGGTISEDMLAQYDAYCEKKIAKFQCLDKKIPVFQQETD